MLIPSKKHMYTLRWSALGQRKMTTKIILSFSNSIVHQFTLGWFIREDKNPMCWFDVESEKLLSVDGGVIMNRESVKKIQTVDIETVMGKESDLVANISSSRINEDTLMILLRAGIIEDVSDDEGEEIICNHIQNMNSFINNKKVSPKIEQWIKDQDSVGIERIIPKRSLFGSKLNISCCKVL